MAKKIIRFHGSLKYLLPEEVEVDANTPIEAMHALVELRPELKQFVALEDRPLVQLVGFETQSLLRMPTDKEVIDVVPAMLGAGGGGGFFKIIIGTIIIAAVLIAAPYLAPEAIAAGSSLWAAAASTTIGSIALSLGTSLILGGLLSLISPVPKRDSNNSNDPEASKYLGAARNTVRIGTRIPIPYGECRLAGHYISSDTQATDVG